MARKRADGGENATLPLLCLPAVWLQVHGSTAGTKFFLSCFMFSIYLLPAVKPRSSMDESISVRGGGKNDPLGAFFERGGGMAPFFWQHFVSEFNEVRFHIGTEL